MKSTALTFGNRYFYQMKEGQTKSYKCIIFDCDGVLVDSEELAIRTFIAMAKNHGAKVELEYALKHLKGNFLGECIRKIEAWSGKALPNEFEAQFRIRSFEIFKNELQPVKGIKKVLKNLPLPFCTASSGPQEKIRSNLTTTGLRHFFGENIFSCYDIERWKPDPAIFLYAAANMGFAPEDCLVVEDTIVGVSAAKAGGFDVFGFAELNQNDDFIGEATAVFYDMDELLPMIDKSFSF